MGNDEIPLSETIQSFVVGTLVWVVAVVALPLGLCGGAYLYIEGAPEISIFFTRVFGGVLKDIQVR